MGKCVLLRHGESTWNAENRFTGWTDVDLSPTGRTEAARAGQTLQDSGYAFDVAFTSVLTRAIRTLWIALDVMEVLWTPIHHSCLLAFLPRNPSANAARSFRCRAFTPARKGSPPTRFVI